MLLPPFGAGFNADLIKKGLRHVPKRIHEGAIGFNADLIKKGLRHRFCTR